MPASSVAIALALRKNRSLGKTFWFTDDDFGSDHISITAAKVLASSYERILYRLQKAKEYLYF
jgi:hypothetical protein